MVGGGERYGWVVEVRSADRARARSAVRSTGTGPSKQKLQARSYAAPRRGALAQAYPGRRWPGPEGRSGPGASVSALRITTVLVRTMPGVPMPERQALRGIAGRRRRGAPFDGAELARRIDELGDMRLSTGSRHGAFAELYAAYTPLGFRLMPFPDDSAIHGGEHRVFVRAVIVDDVQGQVVGEIERDLILDHAVVRHELLKLQDAYRGSGVSLVLPHDVTAMMRPSRARIS